MNRRGFMRGVLASASLSLFGWRAQRPAPEPEALEFQTGGVVPYCRVLGEPGPETVFPYTLHRGRITSVRLSSTGMHTATVEWDEPAP